MKNIMMLSAVAINNNSINKEEMSTIPRMPKDEFSEEVSVFIFFFKQIMTSLKVLKILYILTS